MASARTRTVASVERFFQFSILGLVTSGYFALAGSGYLDRPTLGLTGIGLVIRALSISGLVRIDFPPRAISLAALACIAFFGVDLTSLSHDFLVSTVHSVCFLSVIKIVTARSNRDYVYTGAIAFMELIAAAILSMNASFFVYLAFYILFSIAAFTSAEIRRGFQRHEQSVPPETARFSWRLALIAIAATSGILIITAGLFLLVPRTARAAAMLFPNAPHLTGFSNEINLGNFGEIGNDDRPVMHIQPYTKNLPPNLKWRGAAWSSFDGRRWSEEPKPGSEIRDANQAFASVADDWQRSRRDGRRVIYRVDVRNADAGVLFVAGIPEFINVNSRRLFRTPEDGFRVLSTQGDSLRYEISAELAPPLGYPLSPLQKTRYLRLPPINTRIWTLAKSWAGDGTALDRARRIQDHLRNDFGYELRLPEKTPADPLAEFLFVRKKGHCEYFASAMAVMLRTLGIPSRMVSGFQSGYLNDVSGLFVIRGSDAHAWVEGYIDGRGWVTFDPTPSARNVPRPAGLMNRIDMYLDALDNGWQEWVMSYDLGHQATLATKFELALHGLAKRWPAENTDWRGRLFNRAKFWGECAAAIAIVAAFALFAGPGLWRDLRAFLLVRRIRKKPGSHHDASILYRRLLDLLARQGFQKPAWFTPAEFARHLPMEQSLRVVRFTEIYNAVRFGQESAGTAKLTQLLDEIEHGSRPRRWWSFLRAYALRA